MNSDLDVGQTEEIGVTLIQFDRFASLCRPFVPAYRSMTLHAIPAAIMGQDIAPYLDLAYRDVLAAWREFLAHRNRDRPFVLIGHSQGTIHLIRLLREEIEGHPEAARMLSALLIGYNVEVPQGGVVGGTFRSTPICTRSGQTGCVVAYESFRAGHAPPGDALFGRAEGRGMTIACTNPAALGSDAAAPLDSYWFARSTIGGTVRWSSAGDPPVPFLHTQRFVSGQCVHDGKIGYFALSVNADPHDARADDIPGDVEIGGQRLAGWGLHPIDINVAQGDLVRLVAAQRDAWVASHPATH